VDALNPSLLRPLLFPVAALLCDSRRPIPKLCSGYYRSIDAKLLVDALLVNRSWSAAAAIEHRNRASTQERVLERVH
jgi:hypothetical protein